MPFIAREITGIVALTLSSTALLIAVGVALDTMKQLEAQLTMRRYEGFLK
jgi:preprotein translocase subunit SecY